MNTKHLLMILALGAVVLCPAMADEDGDGTAANSSTNGDKDGDSDDITTVVVEETEVSPKETSDSTVEALLADAFGEESNDDTNPKTDMTPTDQA